MLVGALGSQPAWAHTAAETTGSAPARLALVCSSMLLGGLALLRPLADAPRPVLDLALCGVVLADGLVLVTGVQVPGWSGTWALAHLTVAVAARVGRHSTLLSAGAGLATVAPLVLLSDSDQLLVIAFHVIGAAVWLAAAVLVAVSADRRRLLRRLTPAAVAAGAVTAGSGAVSAAGHGLSLANASLEGAFADLVVGKTAAVLIGVVLAVLGGRFVTAARGEAVALLAAGALGAALVATPAPEAGVGRASSSDTWVSIEHPAGATRLTRQRAIDAAALAVRTGSASALPSTRCAAHLLGELLAGASRDGDSRVSCPAEGLSGPDRRALSALPSLAQRRGARTFALLGDRSVRSREATTLLAARVRVVPAAQADAIVVTSEGVGRADLQARGDQALYYAPWLLSDVSLARTPGFAVVLPLAFDPQSTAAREFVTAVRGLDPGLIPTPDAYAGWLRLRPASGPEARPRLYATSPVAVLPAELHDDHEETAGWLRGRALAAVS